MIISRPKEYVEILLKEIIEITKHAVNNMVHENFKGMCPLHESKDRFESHMRKVEEIKKEILIICEDLTKQNEST